MNEREDYLDRLLRGMEDGPEESNEDDGLFGFDSAGEEDDFLKAFEKSLSDSPEPSGAGSDMDFNLDDIDDIVSNVKDKAGADSQEFLVNTMDGQEGPTEDAGQGLDDLLSGLGSGGLDGFGQEEEDSAGSADGIDSFGADDGIGSFGQEEGDGISPKDELDSMAEELAREMDGLDLDGQEEGEGPIPEEEGAGSSPDGKKGKKAKKEKGEKSGFFHRLAVALFGEDEEEEDLEGAPAEIGDIENISDENMELLKELDGSSPPAESEKERKKREKKEQKEQKKREKAEKKAQKAKEKQAKPKKEKKPKEPKVVEKTKPLPRVPVILIILVGASLVVLIYLSSRQIGYSTSVAEAKDFYEEGDYISAYNSLGRNTEVRTVDEGLYERARITAYLQQQIANYKAYQRYGLYVEALSSLVCGVGRDDINAEAAAQAGAEAEYEEMLGQIQKALQKNYNMGLDEARELYSIRDKEEFTYTVFDVIDNLGLAR